MLGAVLTPVPFVLALPISLSLSLFSVPPSVAWEGHFGRMNAVFASLSSLFPLQLRGRVILVA